MQSWAMPTVAVAHQVNKRQGREATEQGSCRGHELCTEWHLPVQSLRGVREAPAPQNGLNADSCHARHLSVTWTIESAAVGLHRNALIRQRIWKHVENANFLDCLCKVQSHNELVVGR